jgi:type I restriction enzyme S subunit
MRFEDIDPGYMTLVWNSPIVRRQIESMARTTAGIYKVNQKHLESVKIPVPSLDAQRVVSARVGEVAVAARRLGEELKLACDRSRGLRRALLGAAFSGRLTGGAVDMEMVE